MLSTPAHAGARHGRGGPAHTPVGPGPLVLSPVPWGGVYAVPLWRLAQCAPTRHGLSRYIFDLDETLVASTGPVEGPRLYAKLTGRTWSHHGWVTHPESLRPPMPVEPGPILPLFRSYSQRARSRTIVLTGRVEALRPEVEEVGEGVTSRLCVLDRCAFSGPLPAALGVWRVACACGGFPEGWGYC